MSENKLSFEEALKQLEDATQRLESGTLTLDESIAQFEAAVRLIGICENALSDARQRVRILTEGIDGTVTDAPFTRSADDEA